MPYLIGLVVVYLAVSALREWLGLTWAGFGILAIGVPIGVAVLVAISRWATEKTQPTRSIDVAPTDLAAKAGPNLTLDYTDGEGNRTTRVISPFAVVRGQQGLLQDYIRVEAWCHSAQAQRTFRVERMQNLQFRNAVNPASNIRSVLDALVRSHPNLLRAQAEAGLSWVNAADCSPQIITTPTKLLVGLAREGLDLEVTAKSLLIKPDGLVIGFNAQKSVTRGRTIIWLSRLTFIADAETGELVTGDIQDWLLSRCARLSAASRGGGAAPPRLSPREENER